MTYSRLRWKSGTPFSEVFDDLYYSDDKEHRDGAEETMHVFVSGNDLVSRFSSCERFVIAETGFGTGLNFIVTCSAFLETAPSHAHLDYLSIEKYLLHPDDIVRVAEAYPDHRSLFDELVAQWPSPVRGVQRISLFDDRVRLTLYHDDISDVLDRLNVSADAWFLDGFSPSLNAAMWNAEVYNMMARCSHPGTSFATYTVAGHVRRGLGDVGFDVRRPPGYAGKRDMLAGTFIGDGERSPSVPWFDYRSLGRADPEREIVVLGAGIAGLTTSLQLIRRGYSVCLIDRECDVARGASGNPAAIVMPRFSANDDIDNAFYVDALMYACRQYDSLQSACGGSFWFPAGVDVKLDPKRLAAIERKERLNVLLESSHDVHDDIDSWRHILHGGWLRPERLAHALRSACGEALRFMQAEIHTIEQGSEDGIALLANDGELIVRCETLVLANAAAVTELEGVPAFPIRYNLGQVSVLDGLPITDDRFAPISAQGYASPVFEGRLVTGATYRHDVGDDSVRVEDHESNLSNLAVLRPDLDTSEMEPRGRVSQRANALDRVPLVGAVPDEDFYTTEYHDLRHGRPTGRYGAAEYHPGLYCNLAHGSRGFTSAFLCAEIVASLIDGMPSPVDARLSDYLHPARHIIRGLKRSGSES